MLPYMDEASAESSKKGWTNFSSSEDSRGPAEPTSSGVPTQISHPMFQSSRFPIQYSELSITDLS